MVGMIFKTTLYMYSRSKQGEAPHSTPRWHGGVPNIPYDTTFQDDFWTHGLGHSVSDSRSRAHSLDDFEDDFSDVRSRTQGVGRTVLYPLCAGHHGFMAVRNRGKHHSPRHDGMKGCPTFLTTRLYFMVGAGLPPICTCVVVGHHGCYSRSKQGEAPHSTRHTVGEEGCPTFLTTRPFHGSGAMLPPQHD
jgi:hypothetical protein